MTLEFHKEVEIRHVFWGVISIHIVFTAKLVGVLSRVTAKEGGTLTTKFLCELLFRG